jgi:hypothetical protein
MPIKHNNLSKLAQAIIRITRPKTGCFRAKLSMRENIHAPEQSIKAELSTADRHF